MTTLDEITEKLDSTTDFPASHGEVNQNFVQFTVTEVLDYNRFVAVRNGVAIICHGSGGHFVLGTQRKGVNQIHYRNNNPVARPLIEVQDTVLCVLDTEGATTIWSTPSSYEQATAELDSDLD